MAELKAINVAENNPGTYVLGSDTVVVRDRDILGKPVNREEAYEMVKSLADASTR